jgi:hypothetical protein
MISRQSTLLLIAQYFVTFLQKTGVRFAGGMGPAAAYAEDVIAVETANFKKFLT